MHRKNRGRLLFILLFIALFFVVSYVNKNVMRPDIDTRASFAQANTATKERPQRFTDECSVTHDEDKKCPKGEMCGKIYKISGSKKPQYLGVYVTKDSKDFWISSTKYVKKPFCKVLSCNAQGKNCEELRNSHSEIFNSPIPNSKSEYLDKYIKQLENNSYYSGLQQTDKRYLPFAMSTIDDDLVKAEENITTLEQIRRERGALTEEQSRDLTTYTRQKEDALETLRRFAENGPQAIIKTSPDKYPELSEKLREQQRLLTPGNTPPPTIQTNPTPTSPAPRLSDTFVNPSTASKNTANTPQPACRYKMFGYCVWQ